MDITTGFIGLTCHDCSHEFDPIETPHRCPDCTGLLEPAYDYSAISVTPETFAGRSFDSMWRYSELLPFPRETAISLGEGTTPLVDCPRLADEFGVAEVLIKDEGQNPTGTFKDRGATSAITAAVGHNATEIALASAGNAGQSAAAYAARAGLNAHVFLPSRCEATQKDLVDVHGGDLVVIDGLYQDAIDAFETRSSRTDDWYSTQAFDTPYRHEGKKTMFYEIAEQLDWTCPDAIVYPTGGGVGLLGIHKAAREFETLGLIDTRPALYAAQSTGCAPIVEAWNAGASRHEVWADPDTICGGIEVPDPGVSDRVLDALAQSDGGAIATTDEAILDSAVSVARREGVEMGVTSAAAASGARALARRGEFDDDATVVILNTGSAMKTAGILHDHIDTD